MTSKKNGNATPPKLDPDYLTPEREAVANELVKKATPIRVVTPTAR